MQKDEKAEKRKKEFYTEYTARNALKNGSFIVRLSAIVFGLGCLVHKQTAKRDSLSDIGNFTDRLYGADRILQFK